MNTAEAERALIFAWERVRRVPVILPGFLLLAFIGHVGAFFLFRVVYPPQASLPMPPPTITMLDPARPDHQALLRWAEAEDTAPANAQTGITERLLTAAYRPSYTTLRTAPLSLPEESSRIQYPPARDPLAFIRSVEAKPTSLPSPPRSEPTRVTLSPELASRLTADATLPIAQHSTEPLESAEFLIGVTDRGDVRFAILQRSSGNHALDADGAEQLTRLHLAATETPIAWGRAIIHWGADAYSAARK